MVPSLESSLSHIGRWHSLPKGDWSVFPGMWKRTEINFAWQVQITPLRCSLPFWDKSETWLFMLIPGISRVSPPGRRSVLKQESFECANYYPVEALLCKDIAVLTGSLHFWILCFSSPSCLSFFFCFVWRQDFARPGGRALVPALGRDK